MTYKLSIITVCYNEPNLEKTCKSIVEQTYKDFEWVVVDGGSNEQTQKVWNKYKNRINTFVSEKDNGVYNAMNKGIRMANGEHLLFLNAGDYFFDNDVLQKVIDKKLDKDICYGNIIVYEDEKRSYLKRYPNVLDYSFWIKNNLCHQAIFIKKELFEKYGFYNENYKIVSDLELWIIFIHINMASYKNLDVTCSVFINGGLSSNKNYEDLANKERKKVIDKYFTKEEIENAQKEHYSLLENIFSIKNHWDCKHKVLTVLGIHIKLKHF